jgi:hypothetical protein
MNIQELADKIRLQFLQIEGSAITNEPLLLTENPQIPAELQELLNFGNEWINMRIPLYLSAPQDWEHTVSFVGDTTPEEWREEHPGPNCCDENYRSIGSFCEFDEFFVDLNPESPNYGAVRWAVENVGEDILFTPAPFANFLRFLDLWTENIIEAQTFDFTQQSFHSISSAIRAENDGNN